MLPTVPSLAAHAAPAGLARLGCVRVAGMGSATSVGLLEPVSFAAGLALGAAAAFLWLRRRRPALTDDQVLHKYHEENYEFPDPGDECRLVMCIRNDLKMQKGKVAAQCGHASVAAYVKGMKHAPKMMRRWLTYGGTKITLRIDSEQDLLELERNARRLRVLTSVVRDAGQTQVAPGSRTVIAIGPAPQTVLAQLTGHLKLY